MVTSEEQEFLKLLEQVENTTLKEDKLSSDEELKVSSDEEQFWITTVVKFSQITNKEQLIFITC